MTDQEIAQALERLIQEDAKRPPDEQIKDLIKAGVIDKQGRVLIGRHKQPGRGSTTTARNGPASPLRNKPKRKGKLKH